MGLCITSSGKLYDPGRPDPSVVDVCDVAHALSQTCRYGGHSSLFYSVAEHSVRVYNLGLARSLELSASRSYNHAVRLALLFHDAAEAYLDDAVMPFKNRLDMGWYRDLERDWMGAIYEKLGIRSVVDTVALRLIDFVDQQVRGAEMAYLFPTAPEEVRKDWGFEYNGEMDCQDPQRAEQSFFFAYNQIEAAR